MCYHARLSNRAEYRKAVARHFVPPADLKGGADAMEKEIVWLVHSKFSKRRKSLLKYFSGHITLTYTSCFHISFHGNNLKLIDLIERIVFVNNLLLDILPGSLVFTGCPFTWQTT